MSIPKTSITKKATVETATITTITTVLSSFPAKPKISPSHHINSSFGF